jgi:hypothetical protein
MVSGFESEVWASVQMMASRSLCLTQYSLPITRLFVAVRGAFWVLFSFGSLFAAVLFSSFVDPQTTAGQSVGPIAVAKLNFRVRL